MALEQYQKEAGALGGLAKAFLKVGIGVGKLSWHLGKFAVKAGVKATVWSGKAIGKGAGYLTKGVGKGVTKGVTKGLAKGVAKGVSKGVTKGIGKAVSKGVGKGVSKGIGKGVSKGIGKGVKTVSKNVSKQVTKQVNKTLKKVEKQISKQINNNLRGMVKSETARLDAKAEKMFYDVMDQMKNMEASPEHSKANLEKLKTGLKEKSRGAMKSLGVSDETFESLYAKGEKTVSQGVKKLKQEIKKTRSEGTSPAAAKRYFVTYKKKHPGTKKTWKDFLKRTSAEEALDLSDIDEMQKEVFDMGYEDVKELLLAIDKLPPQSELDKETGNAVTKLQLAVSRAFKQYQKERGAKDQAS